MVLAGLNLPQTFEVWWSLWSRVHIIKQIHSILYYHGHMSGINYQGKTPVDSINFEMNIYWLFNNTDAFRSLQMTCNSFEGKQRSPNYSVCGTRRVKGFRHKCSYCGIQQLWIKLVNNLKSRNSINNFAFLLLNSTSIFNLKKIILYLKLNVRCILLR